MCRAVPETSLIAPSAETARASFRAGRRIRRRILAGFGVSSFQHLVPGISRSPRAHFLRTENDLNALGRELDGRYLFATHPACEDPLDETGNV